MLYFKIRDNIAPFEWYYLFNFLIQLNKIIINLQFKDKKFLLILKVNFQLSRTIKIEKF